MSPTLARQICSHENSRSGASRSLNVCAVFTVASALYERGLVYTRRHIVPGANVRYPACQHCA